MIAAGRTRRRHHSGHGEPCSFEVQTELGGGGGLARPCRPAIRNHPWGPLRPLAKGALALPYTSTTEPGCIQLE